MISTEIVSLKSGSFLGRRLNNILEFRGVPYAEPPIGTLRFSPPVPFKKSNSMLDATRDGAIPPQLPSRVDRVLGPINAVQSEDCLTLSIWSPVHYENKLPVVIWFHGGGFSTGAGSLPLYDGGKLVSRFNVIVIGVNYRLGVLGYLSIPDHLPGNLAILDQEAALRWVQKNVDAFGGDPKQVTVIGQSGGAHSIISLLSMDTTDGLFQRAILQSPPLGIGLSTPEETRGSAEIFLKELLLDIDSPDIVGLLREVSLEKLLSAQSVTAEKMNGVRQGNLRPAFTPTELFPHSGTYDLFIRRAVENSVHRGIEILIGWTRDEAKLYYAFDKNILSMTEESLRTAANNITGDESEILLKDISLRHSGSSPAELFIKLISEVCFRQPSLQMANLLMRAGGKVFVYQFDWSPSDSPLGACHCIDLPFVFGNWETWKKSLVLAGAQQQELQNISDITMNNWFDFVRMGEPNFGAWCKSERPILHVDTKPWVEGIGNIFQDSLA